MLRILLVFKKYENFCYHMAYDRVNMDRVSVVPFVWDPQMPLGNELLVVRVRGGGGQSVYFNLTRPMLYSTLI